MKICHLSLSPVETDLRILRGGSWYDFYRVRIASSYRDDFTPGFRDHGIGFRCVVGR